jgi:two-component system, chemotaxis family, protein-glutamate methylesterase/glutaminase
VIKLLIVDDSALMRKLLSGVFSDQREFEIRLVRSGIEALELLGSYQPDVITLDINMPRMDGLTCLDRIMIEHPCPVVMVSTLTTEGADATLEAFHLGAVDFVAKPDGAISLGIHEMTAELMAKVRGAAGAKPRASLRLKERVRYRLRETAKSEWRRPADKSRRESKSSQFKSPITGNGLVLVGTSTGGPPALEALFTALPAHFPWPILVAQHMPASFTGALARRLDGLSALTITEVIKPVTLTPGHVYIGKGDADIIVSSRAAGLVAMSTPAAPDYPWHPSTDRMVRTAMNHFPASQLIGVLMTGMGSDGAAAMAALHAAGGSTIAEARETAVVWGMPGELVAMNGADWVVPLTEIADCLVSLLL